MPFGHWHHDGKGVYIPGPHGVQSVTWPGQDAPFGKGQQLASGMPMQPGWGSMTQPSPASCESIAASFVAEVESIPSAASPTPDVESIPAS